MCGEKVLQSPDVLLLQGSPPRVRGKAHWTLTDAKLIGITPACAGKSSGSLMKVSILPDHPRVCGEKHMARSGLRVGIGSPPRVRGKEEGVQPSEAVVRITPACAGKSGRPIKNTVPE